MTPAWKLFNRDIRVSFTYRRNIKFADWDSEEFVKNIEENAGYPLKIREIALSDDNCMEYVLLSHALDFNTLPKAVRRQLPDMRYVDEKDIDTM